MKTIFTFLFALLSLQTVYSQWQMMNSPLASPDIIKVAQHPSGYLVALTNAEIVDFTEVFRSNNSGRDWHKISTFNIHGIFSLAISPGGVIYVGVSGGYFFSTDDGITWQEKQLMIGFISDIEFNSLGHILMLNAYGDLWLSTNAGNTWNNYFISTELLRSFTKDSLENLFTISGNGTVYRSTNTGYNWHIVSDLNCYGQDIEVDSNNNLFACGDGPNGGIFKSTNHGISWNSVIDSSIVAKLYIDSYNNIYGFNCCGRGIIFSSDGGNSWENLELLEIDIKDLVQADTSIYCASEKGLFKSSIYYKNWSLCFKYDYRFSQIYDLIILLNSKILTGTNFGVYNSYNANSWDSALVTSRINFIKQDSADNIYLSSARPFSLPSNFYHSIDEGNSWELTLSLSDQSIENFFIDKHNSIILVASEFGYSLVLKSLDFGASWDTIKQFNGLAFSKIYGLAQNAFGNIILSSYYVFSPSPTSHTEYKRLMKSDYSGLTWELVRDDLFIKNIYFIKDTMYLATSNQTYYPSSGGIFKSYDNGINIIALNNGLNNYDIKQLILKPEVFLALSGDGIYRSLDNGEYWVRLDHSGLPSTAINRIYYSDDGVLYACTDNGIFVFTGELPVELLSFNATTQTGSIILNWATASELNNQGFEIQRKSKNTEWITIGFKEGKGTTTEKNDYTYTDDVAGINTGEVYYRLKQIDFDGTFTYSEEVKVGLIPFKYELYQNYPNPFNPTTKISWQSPVGSHQTLKVYDVLGNEVATLVNEYREAGNYEVEFDASSLASGMYIYKLSAGSFTSSKKMLILK